MAKSKKQNSNPKNSTKRNGQRSGSKGRDPKKLTEEEKKLRDQEHDEKGSGDYQQTAEKLGSLNDPSWYLHYPALAAAAANVPFPYKPGMSLPLWTDDSGSTRVVNKMGIPGVLKINWVPTVGYANSITDPVNVAGNALFSAIRASFSGSIEADAPDIMQYIVALDSVFSYIAWLKRLYGLLNLYTPENYEVPTTLIAALAEADVNNTQFKNNLKLLREGKPELWGAINTLVNMTRQFKIPQEFDYYNRHRWLNTYVYSDASGVSSQLYLFDQAGFYNYNVSGSGEATLDMQQNNFKNYMAVTTNTSPSVLVNSLYTFGESMINKLAQWDDAFIISGYLERTFKNSVIYVEDEIPYDHKTEIRFEPEVNMQIENSRSIYMGMKAKPTGWASMFQVSQDESKSYLISTLTRTIPATLPATSILPMVNVHSPMTPSTTDVIVATRMQPTWELIAGSDNQYNVYVGTEAVLDYGMYSSVANVLTAQSTMTMIVTGTSTVSSVMGDFALPAQMAFFDWAPWYYVIYSTATTAPYTVTRLIPMGDGDQMTTFEPYTLKEIHRVCTYSEFESFSQF